MGFDEIRANPRVRDYLTAAFGRKTVPHAFLISGTDEVEKRKLAKILAGAIVCTGESAPCDACAACKKVKNDAHPDVMVKECESASIKVDEIREIRRDAYIVPNDGEKKVYIINDADKMTQEAQDALLKILEEPPRFTTFILLCYNHNSLLTTVLSRVTHLKLQDSDSELAVSDEAAENASNIVKAIASRSEIAILQALISCEKKKRDEMSEIMNTAIVMLRDGVIGAVGGGDTILGKSESQQIAKALSVNEILKIIDVLNDCRALVSRNVGVAHVVAKCAVLTYGALI